jgi:hypothetical protein
MTNRNNQQNQQSDLSEAANIMRTSQDPKERSEAARTMGHAGGTQSHKNTNSKDRRDEDS